MEIVRVRERASGIEPSAFPDRTPTETASPEAVSLLQKYLGESLPDAEDLARAKKGRVWVQRTLHEESRSSLLPLSDALRELDPDTQSLIRLYDPEYTGLTIVGFPRFDHIYSAVSSAFPYHISYEGFGSDLANVLNSADYSLCINTRESRVVRSGPTTKATIGVQLEPTPELLEERGTILTRFQTMLAERYLIRNPQDFINRNILCGVPLESRLGTHIPIGHIKQPGHPRYSNSLSLIGGIIKSNLPEEIYLEPITVTNLPGVDNREVSNDDDSVGEPDEKRPQFMNGDTFNNALHLAQRGVDAIDKYGGRAIITTPYAAELLRNPGFSLGRLAVKHGPATFLHIKY